MTADKKILIVDDDPELIALVSAWLAKRDYETISVPDAMSCLASARRNQPDAILLDLGLPAGGGLVALQRLKANHETAMIPVIVLTARNTATARAEAEQAGAFAFVPKEGSKESLLAALHDACEKDDLPDSF